jgi:hypothetical protein
VKQQKESAEMVLTIAEPIERTEAQICEELADERTALAEAQREGAAFRRRRSELLLIGDVDAIEEIDKKGRRADIAAEIAEAKIKPLVDEMERVRVERTKWGGVEMPTDAELGRLLEIISAAHRFVRIVLFENNPRSMISSSDFIAQFKRAFTAVNHMRRTEEVDTKRYFGSHLDDVNEILRGLGMSSVESCAVQAAIFAHGDVKWRRADPALGVVFAVGLSRWVGRPSASAWKSLLAGAPLLAPVAPPEHLMHAREARSQVQFRQAGT